MDRLESGLRYRSWWHVFRAVLEVYRENQSRDKEGGESASSDNWCIVDYLRRDVYERVRTKWAEFASEDVVKANPHAKNPILYFPDSIDGVARLYFKVRKRDEVEIQAFERETMSHYPSKSLFH